MSTTANLVFDSFQKREISHQLATELQAAHERVRLLKLRIMDEETLSGAPNGAESSKLLELRAEHAEAAAKYESALQRFASFVTRGALEG